MNEYIPDRGPRDPEDDHSQNTEQREDPTEEEREESLNECLRDIALTQSQFNRDPRLAFELMRLMGDK